MPIIKTLWKIVGDYIWDVFNVIKIHKTTGDITTIGDVNCVDVTASGVVSADGYFEAVATKTADYTATSSDSLIIADGTSNTVTITLPTAVGITGRIYKIKCIDDTYQVDVDADGTETIDGSLTKTLSQWDCLTVISDGSDWMVI